MNRSVSFEYMNRQLVWNEFSVNLSSFVANTSRKHYLSKYLLRCYMLGYFRFPVPLLCLNVKLVDMSCCVPLFAQLFN